MGAVAKSKSSPNPRAAHGLAPPARAVAKAPQPSKFSWRDLPLHPINDASTILGGSKSRIYGLLAEGKLEAMRLAGKTSGLDALDHCSHGEGRSEPWAPDRKRVEKAVSARPDVIRKRAKTASPRKRGA